MRSWKDLLRTPSLKESRFARNWPPSSPPLYHGGCRGFIRLRKLRWQPRRTDAKRPRWLWCEAVIAVDGTGVTQSNIGNSLGTCGEIFQLGSISLTCYKFYRSQTYAKLNTTIHIKHALVRSNNGVNECGYRWRIRQIKAWLVSSVGPTRRYQPLDF